MKNFSIIIPTFNRPDRLGKLLCYYNNCHKSSYKIIIADSSSDENKIINQKNISHNSNLDILHLKEYKEETHPLNKIIDAINYVQTKYCVFCSDDDFIVLPVIEKCVDFMEKNPDFTVVRGKGTEFFIKTKNKKKEILWVLENCCESNIFPRAEDRFKKHLADYKLPTFYGVHKTIFLKMILIETKKITYDVRLNELLPSMITLIYGKMKCFEYPYIVREINFNSLGQKASAIKGFFREGINNIKYTKFKNCLSSHLIKNSQLNEKEAEKIIDDAMIAYLKKKYPNNNFLMNLVKNIFDLLPGSMRNKIRSFYGSLMLSFSGSGKKLSEILKNTDQEYKKDLLMINDCIMSDLNNDISINNAKK